MTFVFPGDSCSFSNTCGGNGASLECALRTSAGPRATRYFMSLHYFAANACRALTARKDGPSLYDVCEPVLGGSATGDRHLAKFYRTALGNPALRALLRRAGLPELRDDAKLT